MDKTPPAQYEFAYSEGYSLYGSNYSRYSKIIGICHIALNAKKISGNIASNDVIATMPEGFGLSSGGTFVPCIFLGATTPEIGTLEINSGGKISVRSINSSAHTLVFANFSYRAKSF